MNEVLTLSEQERRAYIEDRPTAALLGQLVDRPEDEAEIDQEINQARDNGYDDGLTAGSYDGWLEGIADAIKACWALGDAGLAAVAAIEALK